jgi:superfamily II DNA or RNA helicase
MKKFLEWLREEATTALWSKGVTLSRSPASFERIGSKKIDGELKFKVRTTDRVLAFTVTLWTEDEDAHCDCGSKIHPCHHIIGVAVAESEGRIPEASGPATDERDGLRYHWEYLPPASGSKPSIRFHRELRLGGEVRKIEGSLVALIGGIRSGRIALPLPATTQVDLAIDACLARGPASASGTWSALLGHIVDLGPLPVLNHPRLGELKVRARPERSSVRIRESRNGDLELTLEMSGTGEDLEGGLRLEGDTLCMRIPAPSGLRKRIPRDQVGPWTLNELPVWKDSCVVMDERTATTEVIEGTPFLELTLQDLGPGQLRLTGRVGYPPALPGQVIRPSPEQEIALIKTLRQDFGLYPDQPRPVSIAEAIRFRERLPEGVRQSFDFHLGPVLRTETGLELDAALEHRDLLLELLDKKQKPEAPVSMIDRMLQTLPLGTSPPPSLLPGEIPPALEGILRPYQRAGAAWILRNAGALGCALLADDMGLGKTLQTLATIRGKTLVIVPRSLLGNWQREASRFRPDLKVSTYHGPGRQLHPDSNLILTTYSILQLDAPVLCSRVWDMVVLDEAHQIRNPETRAAMAATRLNSRFRLALTGTPIQNSKRDLLSLFRFLAPGLFEEESELTPSAIAPFMLRRTKHQVLTELPPKTPIDHPVILSEIEKSRYDALLSAAKRECLDRLGTDRKLEPLTIFEVLLRARQACCHPGLLEDTLRADPSSKMETLLSLVEEILSEDHSVLVYSQWTRHLDLIESRMKDRFPLFRLDGSTRDRDSRIGGFQESPQASVFLLSLQAGGVGLNLTRANHVIFCDPWWNPYVELQAEDRAYRMGQEKPVTVHRLVAEDTIETSIRDLQAQKLRLGDATLSAEEMLNLIR